jgi:uncharacterized protein
VLKKRVFGWMAGLATVGSAVLLGAATPASSADKSADAAKPPKEQRVEIQADGYVIPGTFTMPRRGKGPFPTVLLLHGTASSKDEVGNMYARVADKLSREGFASLRIDFAGCGDSKQPQTAFTFTEEVSDAKTALDWLSANSKVDPDAIGMVGFSQGGRVAATVAGTDSRVKALTTWSSWVEDGTKAYLLFGGEEGYAKAKQDGHVVVDLGFRTWDFSLEYFEAMKASQPLKDIAGYKGPLLGIEGTDDFLWPQTKIQGLEAGSYEQVLHIIPGADHIFHVLTPDQTQADDVIDTTAQWFAQTLHQGHHHSH